MKKITHIRGCLLEGCIWDDQNNALYFIDIEDRKIYRYFPESHDLQSLSVPNSVGCIVLESNSNRLVAALQDGLYAVDFEASYISKIMESNLPTKMRYNDGKCDVQGTLWVGSMAVSQEEPMAAKAGSLYCITKQQIVKQYAGYTIPNGLAWDRQMHYLYHIDSSKKEVVRYTLKEDGSLGLPTVAMDLQTEEGVPDGMCMDADGNLWIAMWGGSKVICCNPNTAKIIRKIVVPDKNVSCCVFGGANLDKLYITTAKDEMGQGGEVYEVNINIIGTRGYRYVR